MPHSVHSNTGHGGQAVPSVSSLSIGNPGNAYSGGSSSRSSSSSGLYPYYGGASSSVSIGPNTQKPVTTMLNRWLRTLDRESLVISEVLFASYQVSPVPERRRVLRL